MNGADIFGCNAYLIKYYPPPQAESRKKFTGVGRNNRSIIAKESASRNLGAWAAAVIFPIVPPARNSSLGYPHYTCGFRARSGY